MRSAQHQPPSPSDCTLLLTLPLLFPAHAPQLLLTYNPKTRITARDAMGSHVFDGLDLEAL